MMGDEKDIAVLVRVKEILRQLSVTLGVFALYPATHQKCREEIASLIQIFQEYFTQKSQLLLAVTNHHWLLQGEPLKGLPDFLNHTAMQFHKKGISGICFSEGLPDESLIGLFEFLNDSQTMVQDLSERPVSKKGEFWPSIQLLNLDLEKMQLVDSYFETHSLDDIPWDKFLTTFSEPAGIKGSEDVSGAKNGADAGDIPKQVSQFSKVEDLGLLLNKVYEMGGKEGIDRVVKFLEKLGKKCLTRESSSNVEHQKFINLLMQLDSGILTDLEKFSISKKNIPKADVQYQQRLIHTLNLFSDSDQKTGSLDTSDLSQDEILSIHSMFQSQSKITEGSSDSYKNTINQMMTAITGILTDKERVPFEKIAQRFDPKATQRQLQQVMLDMLEIEMNAEDYYSVAQQLKSACTASFRENDFNLILEVFLFFDRHTESKANPIICQSATQMIDQIFHGGVVYDWILNWSKFSDLQRKPLEKILLRLNRTMVLTQFKLALNQAQSEDEKELLTDFLSQIASADFESLQEEIKTKNMPQLKNLIKLLSKLSHPQAAHLLRELLRHSNEEIQNLAYHALLGHGTQESLIPWAQNLLKLPEKEFFEITDSMVKFGKKDLFSSLIPEFTRQDLFERSYSRRIFFLQEIGKSRNPFCLNLLTKAYNAKPFFRSKRNSNFKMAILNALSKINTSESLWVLSILSQKGDTALKLTGSALLDTRKNHNEYPETHH